MSLTSLDTFILNASPLQHIQLNESSDWDVPASRFSQASVAGPLPSQVSDAKGSALLNHSDGIVAAIRC